VEGGNTNSVDSNYDSKETFPNTAFKRYHHPLSGEDGNAAGLLTLANVGQILT
jgi:hypothetical protein